MMSMFFRFCFLVLWGFLCSVSADEKGTAVSATEALAQSSFAQAELLQKTKVEALKQDAERVELIALNPEKPQFPPLELLKTKQPAVFGASIDQDLPYFGSAVFGKMQLELSRIPLHQRRIPNEYILGPGDMLSLHVWNQTQDQLVEGEINQNGMLQFPLVGEIRLQGVTVGKLIPYLKSRLESYYREIDLSFELTGLKQFPVYLTGEVRVPGVQIANCISTPIQLLMAAGGVRSRGSLRNIRHIRNGQVLRQIDLYDFLLKGTLGEFIFMEAEDVLHVPMAERQLAFAGRIKRPAVYELLEKENFSHLLEFSGGFEADADRGLLQYISFDGRGEPEITDVDLQQAKNLAIYDGSILIVHASGVRFRKGVTITGNVFKPGVFAWTANLTVKELVEKAQGIKPNTARDRAEIVRVLQEMPHTFNAGTAVPVRTENQVFTINLHRELSGEVVTTLEKEDVLHIFNLTDVQLEPTVEVKGEVKNAGSYPLRANQKLSDVLSTAVLTGRSHRLKGEVARKNTGETELIPFEVKDVMAGKEGSDLFLLNNDVVFVFGEPESARLTRVTLSGEVRFPGTYVFQPQDKLSDVIQRAGGLTEHAWLPGALFTRQRIKREHEELRKTFIAGERRRVQSVVDIIEENKEDKKGAALAQVSRDMEEAESALQALEHFELEGRLNLNLWQVNTLADLIDSENDLFLEDGDSFYVSKKPIEVIVYGQVMSPGTLLFRDNLNLVDYLELVGGYSDSANRNKVFIVRSNGDGMTVSTLARNEKSNRYVRNVKESVSLTSSIMPGDKIIVPAKIRISQNRFHETLDSIYKIAISVGALGALFK